VFSWVVIPQKLLKLLDWKSGQELDGEVKDGKLIIKKKKK
jgi:antitoxin component of MazEF toxin-antitoxin module